MEDEQHMLSLMNNNFPTETEVYGLKIKVVNKKLDEALGDCQVHNRTINIDISKHDEDCCPYSTLLHERIHMAIGLAGLTHMLGEDLEESVVECIESAFYNKEGNLW